MAPSLSACLVRPKNKANVSYSCSYKADCKKSVASLMYSVEKRAPDEGLEKNEENRTPRNEAVLTLTSVSGVTFNLATHK